jgi:hypothetical protein
MIIMKPMIRSNWLTAAGLLLALPAAWLICISVLKYGLHINEPFDASQPLLERWGIKESFGWNINLLILTGPVVCFLLSVFQVLKIRWEFSKKDLHFSFTVHKRWFPILVGAFSLGLLAVLFFYLLGENCNC